MSAHAPAAVLFDLEGTLLDSTPAISATLDEIIGSDTPGPCTWSYEDLRDPLVAAQRHGVDPEMFALRLAARTVRPFEHVARRLRSLSETHKLALITNSRRVVAEALLRSADLTDCFDTVVTADDVVLAKPDPEGVLVAAARLGCPVSETLVVGDTPADLAAASAAGARGTLVHDFWHGQERHRLASG